MLKSERDDEIGCSSLVISLLEGGETNSDRGFSMFLPGPPYWPPYSTLNPPNTKVILFVLIVFMKENSILPNF